VKGDNKEMKEMKKHQRGKNENSKKQRMGRGTTLGEQGRRTHYIHIPRTPINGNRYNK